MATTLALYYRRGGKQHGENVTAGRGEFEVAFDGKTWVYETPPHTKKREIRKAILVAFSPDGRGTLSGKFPRYSFDTPH